MAKKTFDFYRYQLVIKDNIQLNLFDKTYTIDEIKENKNRFFGKILTEADYQNRNGFIPIKFNMAHDGKFWIQLANIKEAKYVQDFEEHSITSKPFVNILIDNDPLRQIIAISHNHDAYKKTTQVVDVLLQSLNPLLDKYNLKLYISPIFESNTFWGIVEQSQDNIVRVEIEIIKPNMSNISSCLKEDMKTLIEDTNSHTTTIKLESYKEGVLDGINKNNENLVDLVDYSSKGGGNIRVKVKKRKNIIQTKNSGKKISTVFEIDAESDNADKVIQVVSNILNKVE